MKTMKIPYTENNSKIYVILSFSPSHKSDTSIIPDSLGRPPTLLEGDHLLCPAPPRYGVPILAVFQLQEDWLHVGPGLDLLEQAGSDVGVNVPQVEL